MTLSRRFSATLLAAVLTAVMLFSVFFIVLESNHDCPGEDCFVCVLLHSCEGVLRQSALVSAVLSAAALLRSLWSACALWPFEALVSATPVSLKVKISD